MSVESSIKQITMLQVRYFHTRLRLFKKKKMEKGRKLILASTKQVFVVANFSFWKMLEKKNDFSLCAVSALQR